MIKIKVLVLLSFGEMTSTELNRFLQINLGNLRRYLCRWVSQGYLVHSGRYMPFELTERGRDTLESLGSALEVWVCDQHRVGGASQ